MSFYNRGAIGIELDLGSVALAKNVFRVQVPTSKMGKTYTQSGCTFEIVAEKLKAPFGLSGLKSFVGRA